MWSPGTWPVTRDWEMGREDPGSGQHQRAVGRDCGPGGTQALGTRPAGERARPVAIGTKPQRALVHHSGTAAARYGAATVTVAPHPVIASPPHAVRRSLTMGPAPEMAADANDKADLMITATVSLVYSHQGQEFSDHAAELRKHPQVVPGARTFFGCGSHQAFPQVIRSARQGQGKFAYCDQITTLSRLWMSD